VTHPRISQLVAAAMIAIAGAASAGTTPEVTGVPIVETAGPGGFLGYWGSDVYKLQSVAERFTLPADGDMRLTLVALWLMNNSDTQQKRVQLSVQTDALDEGGSDSIPSGVVLDRWSFVVEALGWNPVEQSFNSKRLPLLKAGRSYWVVAESMAPATVDPVWTFASEGTMFATTSANGVWQTGGSGAALTLRVEARALR